MADVNVNFKVGRLLSDLKKVQTALIGVRDAERSQISSTVRLNEKGNILSATIRGLGKEGERFKAELAQVKGELRAVAVSTDKAANAQDRAKAKIAETRAETKRLREETARFRQEQAKTSAQLRVETAKQTTAIKEAAAIRIAAARAAAAVQVIEARKAATLEIAQIRKVAAARAAAAKKAASDAARAEARKTTRSIGQKALGPGGQGAQLAAGTTQRELFNFQNELGKLAELQARHNLTSKQVLAQWRTVAAGRVNAETGARRQIQAQLLRLQEAQRRLGNEARNTAARTAKSAIDPIKPLDEAKKATDRFALSWKNLLRIAAISLGLRAINAFIGAIREGITAAQEFSIAVAEIQTIDRAAVSTAVWTENLRELSDEFGIDIVDQAEAAYQALSNQIVTGADATQFLAEANKLALTAVTDTSTAVKILTATLNAFDIDASRTEEVSAKLFKTVELGRVRLDEIADRFGRVAVPADQLGVTLDELNAAIATVTIRGVKAEEATTLLRNIFLKLIRPTEAMKDFLGELGFNSGQAAVETLGLEGVLRALEERTQGSASEIGELFGRIRAITGAMIFAGEGVNDFGRNLEEVSKSAETFSERTDLIRESAGQQLRKALNEVVNIFKVDIGQTALEAVRDLAGGFEFLVTGANALISTVRFLAISAIPLLLVGLGKLVIALIAARTAFFALIAANPLLVFAAAAGVVLSIILAISRARAEAAQAAADAAQAEVDAIQTVAQEEQKVFNARLSAQNEFLKNRQRLIVTSASEIIGAVNTESKAFVAAFELISKATQAELKDLANSAKEDVKSAEDAFDRTQKKITTLQASIAGAFEDEGRTVFDLQFGAIDTDDPQAQISLITDRINELKTELETATNLKAFDALEKEIVSLSKQRGQLLVQNVQDGQQQEAINSFAADLNATLTTGVNLRKELLRLSQEQLKVDQARKDETQTIQDQIAQSLKDFKAFDPEELARGDDADASAKAFEEQRATIQKILELDAQLGSNTLDRLQLESLLNKTKLEQEKQFIRIQLQGQVDNAKNARSEIIKNRDLAAKTLKEQEADQRAIQTRLAQFAADLRDPEGAIRTAAGRGIVAAAGIGRGEQVRVDDPRITQGFDTLARQLEIASEALKDNDVERLNNAAAEAAKTLQTIANAGFNLQETNVADIFETFFVQVVGGVNRQVGVLNQEQVKAAQETQAILQLLTGNFSSIQNTTAQIAQNQQLFDQAVADLDDNTSKLAKLQSEQLTRQAVFNEALDKTTGSIGKFETALDNIVKFLRDNPLPSRNGDNDLFRGGFVKRFADGGFVPRGTDTVPAMLTPGEFVMNAAASRKFASQLVSMNSNIQPQRFQNGGPVNNNSTVNLNVSMDGATASPNEFITEVGRKLQQQVRRGTLPSFN